MRSIRRRLLFWLLAIVLAGVALAGGLIYRQAQAEANALFDYQLRETAAALPSEPFSSALGAIAGNATSGEGVVIQIWSRDGVQLYYSHPRAPLAPHAELGFSTESTPRGDWRVYSAIVGDNVVQLAQPMSVRNALAAQVAWRTLWPLLVLWPVLGILVWFVVGRGLLPLARVARALDRRQPDAIEPFDETPLPREVKPLVRALNRLLVRLSTALDTQKAFVADAAHELRTPLAALQVQLQWLERAPDAAARRAALRDLKQGVERATRLVEQMLSLARAEAPAATVRDASGQGGAAASEASGAAAALAVGVPQRVELSGLLGECVAEQAPLAIARGIDLGLAEASAAWAEAERDGLRTLFRNLLDNAVKYTPNHGRIDVTVGMEAGCACVEIVDSGPGIPEPLRERVFDRFYRLEAVADLGDTHSAVGAPLASDARPTAQGSGLGLAIVRRIAEKWRATVTLGAGGGPAQAPGLRVRVVFPPLAALPSPRSDSFDERVSA